MDLRLVDNEEEWKWEKWKIVWIPFVLDGTVGWGAINGVLLVGCPIGEEDVWVMANGFFLEIVLHFLFFFLNEFLFFIEYYLN